MEMKNIVGVTPTEYEMQKKEKKYKLVRNEFKMVGKYDMPLVKKQNIDLDTIDLWGCTKVVDVDKKNGHKTIHFFTYDWLFDAVYDNPSKLAEIMQCLLPTLALMQICLRLCNFTAPSKTVGVVRTGKV